VIGWRERCSYAAGDLGFNFIWQSIEFYLLFFYVRDLGLSPAAVSAIFLAGGIADWLADPVIGIVADRLGPRVPLRYWVGAGGPVAALLLVVSFAVRPSPHGSSALVAFAAYLALRIAYSVGNIPYAALTARISPLRADQLALTSARMQGAAAGGLIAASVYAAIPTSGAQVIGFEKGALLLAFLAMPAFLITCFGVRERVARAPLPASVDGTASRAVTFTGLMRGSSELRRLLAVILATGTTVTVLNKSLLFIFQASGTSDVGIYLPIFPPIALFVTAPMWTALGGRLGRSRVFTVAVVVQAAAILCALASQSLVPILVATAVAIIAGEGASVLFWALVPEVVGECEAASPDAGGCAGQVYALVNIARKFAQALAPQAIAIMLLMPGRSILWAAATIAVLAAIVAISSGLTKR
jgi:Na+/melibiose symporter-like transporter